MGASVPETAVATADGDELTIKTTEPAPFLLERIGALKMACQAALDDPASVRGSSNGTGLFKITEVVANDHVTLERRDGYNWGPNGETTSDTLGVPKTVTIKVVTDAATTANLVLTGTVNAAPPVAGADIERVEASGLESMTSNTLSGQFIFNHNAALPTKDEAVRTALVQAIDLDDYTDINTGGKGSRATALAVVDPRACDFDSVTGVVPKFDMAAAKKTLADAGWKPGSDGVLTKDGQALQLTVIFANYRDTTSAAAEYAMKQWQELGAKVELRGGDNNFIISNTFAAKDLTSWSISIGLTVQSDTPPSIFVPYFAGPHPPTVGCQLRIDRQSKVRRTGGEGLGSARAGILLGVEGSGTSTVHLVRRHSGVHVAELHVLQRRNGPVCTSWRHPGRPWRSRSEISRKTKLYVCIYFSDSKDLHD